MNRNMVKWIALLTVAAFLVTIVASIGYGIFS